MIIETVNEDNIRAVAEVHAAAWRESHRSFCSPEFVKLHTVERQECYIRGKRMAGSRFFLLTEEMPLGVVSITDSVVEDLYILPAYQNRGYGTRLLHLQLGNARRFRSSGFLATTVVQNAFIEEPVFCQPGRKNSFRKPSLKLSSLITSNDAD